jgi:hypothetical protein
MSAASARSVPEPVAEGATRVEASPFDGPTMQTSRFDEAAENTTTGIHVPRPSRRPSAEDDLTQVCDEPSGEDGPTDVQTALPPVLQTSPLGLRNSNTPPWGTATSTGGRGVPPPAPLPPPPGAKPLIRIDPPDSFTNPATVLPREHAAPAPVEDEISARSGEPADGEQAAVPPMPLPPGTALLPAVRYLLPLARAVWARIKAQRVLRDRLHGDQRLLDDTLHDLGRAAWEEKTRPAELREELGRADEDEGRRKQAEGDAARLDMEAHNERERFTTDEARRKSEIAGHEAEIIRLTEDLAERRRAQKVEQKTFREIEARYLAAEKSAEQLRAKAARAEITPPEKGGGTNTAANLRQQAEVIQRESDGFKPERDVAEAKVRALDAPIAELEQRLQAEREALTTARADLETARAAHHEAITTLEAHKQSALAASATAEKNIRLRLVSTGTLLSLHRLDGPQHRDKFGPIYLRLDELKQIASAREQRINQLEIERHGYDRPGLQRGLIVVGAVLGVLLIVLVVVIVLFAR